MKTNTKTISLGLIASTSAAFGLRLSSPTETPPCVLTIDFGDEFTVSDEAFYNARCPEGWSDTCGESGGAIYMVDQDTYKCGNVC